MTTRRIRASGFSIIALGLIAGPAFAQSDAQIAELRRLLSNLPNQQVTVSACFMRLPSCKIFFEKNANRVLIPASNQKIIASAVALDVFGLRHTFDTTLSLRGDDLVIRGSGDPALGDSRLAKENDRKGLSVFTSWAEGLRARGLKHITGDIIIADSAFDREWVHPSWEKEDLQKWFAAPVGALNFNDNCIEVTVRPTSPGARASFEIYPPNDWITINNRCKTGNSKKPWIRRPGDEPIYELRGQCRKRSTLQSVAVTDPGFFTGAVLRKLLEAEGIGVTGQVRRASPGATAQGDPTETLEEIAVHRTPITDVIKRSLRDSQNLFAECLMKSIGRQSSGKVGTWTNGSIAIRRKLESWGLDTTGLVVADGSGLSRDNRISARQMVEVLKHMYLDGDKGKVFMESLPLNGVSGTLRKRMKDIPGHVWAKTGYMRGIRPLSGYIMSDEGKWFAFSVIFNNIPGSTWPYNNIHDELCRTLVRSK